MAYVFRSPAIFLLFLVLSVLGGGGYFLFQDMTPPSLQIVPETDRVSPGQPFSISATDSKSHIRHIAVSVRKGTRTQVIIDQQFADKQKIQTVSFVLMDLHFKEGPFELEVRAADDSLAGFGRGNTVTKIWRMRLDSTPPRLSIKSTQPYVRRGGSGVIAYSISKEVVRSGITVGGHFFPGFKQDSGDYICFFAFPYFLDVHSYQPELSAVDTAGNKASIQMPLFKIPQNFKKDTIALSDNFLNEKMPYFEPMAPGSMTNLERFQKVTNELRKENVSMLLEFGKKTSPAMLWQDYFFRMPGAPRAGFADSRTYTYNGQKLHMESVHLGLDLADIAQSPVPAANAGNVVYAGVLGIYGNLVVLDHGLGLQSLYSHLSEIHVVEGQPVTRGQIIGKTGATGMAGGDHLHFGITVSGLEVSPIEWIDGNWIRANIMNRLTAAGVVAPGVNGTSAPLPVSPATARAAPTKKSLPANNMLTPAMKRSAPKKR